MKTIGLILLIGMFLSVEAQKANTKKKVESMPVESLIGAIDEALDLLSSPSGAYQLPDGVLPPFSEAKAVLQTEATSEKGGAFKFFIKIGGDITSTKTQQMTFVFKPRSAKMLNQSDEESLAKTIASAVRGAADSVQNSKTPLKLDSFTLDLEFVVKKKGELGFAVEFYGASAEGGISKAREITQKLSIEFSEPKQ